MNPSTNSSASVNQPFHRPARRTRFQNPNAPVFYIDAPVESGPAVQSQPLSPPPPSPVSPPVSSPVSPPVSSPVSPPVSPPLHPPLVTVPTDFVGNNGEPYSLEAAIQAQAAFEQRKAQQSSSSSYAPSSSVYSTSSSNSSSYSTNSAYPSTSTRPAPNVRTQWQSVQFPSSSQGSGSASVPVQPWIPGSPSGPVRSSASAPFKYSFDPDYSSAPSYDPDYSFDSDYSSASVESSAPAPPRTSTSASTRAPPRASGPASTRTRACTRKPAITPAPNSVPSPAPSSSPIAIEVSSSPRPTQSSSKSSTLPIPTAVKEPRIQLLEEYLEPSGMDIDHDVEVKTNLKTALMASTPSNIARYLRSLYHGFLYYSGGIYYIWSESKLIWREIAPSRLSDKLIRKISDFYKNFKFDPAGDPLEPNFLALLDQLTSDRFVQKIVRDLTGLIRDSKFWQFLNPISPWAPTNDGKICNILTGETRIRTYADQYTFTLNAHYAPDLSTADSNQIHNLCLDLMGGHPGIAHYLLQALALSISGGKGDRTCLILGGNQSKNVILELLRALLGASYETGVSPNSISTKTRLGLLPDHGSISFNLFLKLIYRVPTHFILTTDQDLTLEMDPLTATRVLWIPFGSNLSQPEIQELQNNFTTEHHLNAFFTLLVQFGIQLASNGLVCSLPMELMHPASFFVDDRKPYADFIEARCVLGPEYSTQAKTLYNAYVTYTGLGADSITNFGMTIVTWPEIIKERGKCNKYIGIGLRK